jgi:hypothetical protein
LATAAFDLLSTSGVRYAGRYESPFVSTPPSSMTCGAGRFSSSTQVERRQ